MGFSTGRTKELTSGRALPLLLGFTVPILLGNVLQQVYLLTDSAIVSNFLGVRQLAAVGASTSITFLILGFCNGCAGGMAIPVAQAFGARDYHRLRKYVFNSLFLVFSTSLNVALDLCFILLFGWGVAGAAVATVTAQGCAAILCYRFMMTHYDVLRECPEDRKFDPASCRDLLAIGTPMGLQFSITAIGSIMIQSSNNALGTVYVAAFAAGIRIKMLFMCVLESLGIAMTTFCGQNLGAGKTDRVLEGIRAVMLMIVVYCVAAFAVMWPLAERLAMVFVDSADAEIISAAAKYIRVSVSFFFFLGTLCLFRYSIQGLGFTNFAMWSGFMEMVARVLVSVLLVAPFGYTAVCFGDAIAWLAANLFLVPAFIHVYRKVR